jgi:hypothetical protein
MKQYLMLVLLSLAGVLQAAERPQAEFEMTAPGDLEIGPDGAVRSWKMDSHKLGDSVESLLQNNIAQWHFEPVRVDGRPVIARTRMSVELKALPQAEGYLLKVSNVTFGSAKSRGKLVPPSYPTDAIRAGLGARVLLSVKLDAQGNVAAAHPYQTSLNKHGRERQAERWRKRFEQVSLAAVKKWKFEPAEALEGNPVGSTVMVPITFVLTSRPKGSIDNRWLGFVPGPVTPAPWIDADSVAQLDLDGLDDGESASLDSRFKLTSDVVGKAL